MLCRNLAGVVLFSAMKSFTKDGNENTQWQNTAKTSGARIRSAYNLPSSKDVSRYREVELCNTGQTTTGNIPPRMWPIELMISPLLPKCSRKQEDPTLQIHNNTKDEKKPFTRALSVS